MIRNQWYAVLDSKEVQKNKLIGVTRMSEKLVFWRDANGVVSCIADKCCHRGAAISCGKLLDNGRPQCPFHGFEYDGTGRVVSIPANGHNASVPERYAVHAYPICEKGGFIWLWWGDGSANPPEPRTFTELETGYSYSTFRDSWPVHYSRSIENQLDVVHVPFVHYNTIGRGGATLVNGPRVEWDGDRMTFYTHNVCDDGLTIPQKPDEMKDYKRLFHLSFQFPNTWQNYIGDKLRVMAAFAPVDESNSVVYVRFYQSFLHIPGLRGLVNWFGSRFDKIVLRQDKRVVIKQVPIKTGLAMGEKLVQGDRPIAEYRQYRHELMMKAGQTEKEQA